MPHICPEAAGELHTLEPESWSEMWGVPGSATKCLYLGAIGICVTVLKSDPRERGVAHLAVQMSSAHPSAAVRGSGRDICRALRLTMIVIVDHGDSGGCMSPIQVPSRPDHI